MLLSYELYKHVITGSEDRIIFFRNENVYEAACLSIDFRGNKEFNFYTNRNQSSDSDEIDVPSKKMISFIFEVIFIKEK